MRRAVAGALLAGALAAAGAAAAPSAALAAAPAGMGYELASPLASGGIDFTRAWLMPAGDRILLGSETGDVNSLFPAVRTDAGWQPTGRRALTPPNGTSLNAAGTVDVSDDGGRLVVSAVAPDFSNGMVTDRLALSEPDGSWKVIGAGLRYVDGSPDLGRIVVQAWFGQSDDARFPGVPGREAGVYLWEAEGAVTPIGADHPRVLACGAQVPDERWARTLEQSGVSPDARAVVLTTRAGCADPGTGDPLPQHVLRWRDGETVDLTATGDGTDGDATFVGASRDLESVFVRTALALDPADANAAEDVYRWDAASGARTRLTGAATDAGETLTSALASADGARLWFATSDGAGTAALWTAARGEPAARIASEPEPSPSDPLFDLTSGDPAPFPAQTTADGGTLVWTTRTAIDGSGGTTSFNEPGQLFRATADGALACLSCHADGSPAETVSPGGRLDGIIATNRAVSDDGRWIAFETTTALEPEDRNRLRDVYLWHDGRRSLLSAGEPGIRADLANVSARGDVAFKTYAKLLPWVDDDHLKAYVARVGGGGLPGPDDPRESCEGDGCQGGPAPREPGLEHPSQRFAGRGDSDDAAPPFPANPRLWVHRLTPAQQRRLARGRAVVVTARANVAGRVTAATRVRRGRRWAAAGATGRTLRRAGRVRLRVRLSRGARAQLARRGALRVRIEVVHRQVAAPRRLAFTLRRPAARTRRGHRG